MSFQVLLHEQLSEGAHIRELEVIRDYEKKLKNLYNLVSQKEQKIHQLEKNKVPEVHEGVLIQNREVKKTSKQKKKSNFFQILGVHEQVIRIHEEYELQKTAMVRMAKEMGKLNDEKNELLSINYVIQ